MRGGEASQAEQRAGHRDAGLLGELDQGLAGSGAHDALPGQDQRPLRAVDQRGRPIEVGRRRGPELAPRARWGAVAGVELEGGLLRVLGDVDVHRAGPPGAREVEGFAQRRVDLFRFRDQVVVLGDGQRDAGDVRLLERVAAQDCGRHLPGNADDGRRIHHRGGDAGDQVGRSRTGGGDGDSHLPRGARVAVGHVGGPLLVTDQHVPDRVAGHRVVSRHDRATRVAEDGLDALAHEGFPDRL